MELEDETDTTDDTACIDTLLDGPILVLAPHPDDETLGCGALLSHAFARHGAHVICMTDGSAAPDGPWTWSPGEHGRHRLGELDLAVSHLGGHASDITCLRRPAGWTERTETFRMLATHIGVIAGSVGARRIFATAGTGGNDDHRATACVAELAASLYGLDLWYYPVWSQWNAADLADRSRIARAHRLPLGAATEAKTRALGAHRSQLDAAVPDAVAWPGAPRTLRDLFLGRDEVFFKPASPALPCLSPSVPDEAAAEPDMPRMTPPDAAVPAAKVAVMAGRDDAGSGSP